MNLLQNYIITFDILQHTIDSIIYIIYHSIFAVPGDDDDDDDDDYCSYLL